MFMKRWLCVAASDTDVKVAAAGVAANLKINPLVFGVGVGMKL